MSALSDFYKLKEATELIASLRTIIEELVRRIKEMEEQNVRFIKSNIELANINSDYFERIEELEAEREWQPIESAPKDGTLVLILDDYIAIGSYYAGMWFADGITIAPTHWQPLPEPPKEE